MLFSRYVNHVQLIKIFKNKNSLTLSDFCPLTVQKILFVSSVLAGADWQEPGRPASVPSGAAGFVQEVRSIRGGPGGGPGGEAPHPSKPLSLRFAEPDLEAGIYTGKIRPDFSDSPQEDHADG
jgi:hypothetical protein